MRVAAIVTLLVACRQAGTIEVSLGGSTCIAESGASYVAVKLILDGECGGCACEIACPVCAEGCVTICERQGECSIDDPIELDPPEPGSYAVVVEYFTVDDVRTAAVCFRLEVDVDGRESRSQVIEADDTACCPP